MRIFFPDFSGFCPGVKKAEKEIFKRAESSKEPIYVLGQLIHNRYFTEELENRGVFVKNSIEDIPQDSHVIIRTHGIPRQTEEILRKKYRVTDLTCYKVKALQKVIREYADKGYGTIISGKREHPEVQGLISYAGDYWVLKTKEEMEDFFYNRAKQDKKLMSLHNLLLVSQTTAKEELFFYMAELAKKNLPGYKIEIHNSVCSITSMREEAALKLQQDVDASLVIGDHSSSNASKLYELLREKSENTWFITCLDDLIAIEQHLEQVKRLQIVSSSSTPKSQEKEIINHIKQKFPVEN
ncbi:4-hydroxy-3-methylbut-2-enyl diphosphate reductase [Spirochaetia bacterium 38H-sp]|uniref:4-hydroxy-3-methylbut-2-enyl diphosphate reductase n=1 Tax=Rarispira pelagica TaxID=3141764 RepID=A0ABU9UCT6_9SPIR